MSDYDIKAAAEDILHFLSADSEGHSPLDRSAIALARNYLAARRDFEGRTIQFTVYGQSQPAGSKRAFAIRNRSGSFVTRANGSPVIAVTDDNPKSRDWKESVASAARQEYHGDLLTGPVRLTLTFFRPRPAYHYGAKGLSTKGLAMPSPTTKPDVLKLARAVEDALTGVVWKDDAQIVDERLVKEWGEPARCEVTVEVITKGNP